MASFGTRPETGHSQDMSLDTTFGSRGKTWDTKVVRTAKSDFRAHIHLQPVQYEDWDSSADQIGEGIKSEPYVAREVGDVRRKAFTMNGWVPDCSHRPALHQK